MWSSCSCQRAHRQCGHQHLEHFVRTAARAVFNRDVAAPVPTFRFLRAVPVVAQFAPRGDFDAAAVALDTPRLEHARRIWKPLYSAGGLEENTSGPRPIP